MENFRTIKEDGSYENVIKKSRFICQLKRTETEEEASEFINKVKKEHDKATHNCSAYMIGDHDQIQRAHDDGEPSGTAGVPMLEIFKKRELKNVTAVVTRYFGGTKLGAGGLIRAYGGAVNDAVDAIGVIERQLLQQIYLTVEYPQSGLLENELRESDYILNDTQYTDKVTFICFVQNDKVDKFKEETANWLSGKGKYEMGSKAWLEVDVPS